MLTSFLAGPAKWYFRYLIPRKTSIYCPPVQFIHLANDSPWLGRSKISPAQFPEYWQVPSCGRSCRPRPQCGLQCSTTRT